MATTLREPRTSPPLHDEPKAPAPAPTKPGPERLASLDAYRGFTGRPAAMFALPVVRRPGAGVVTALGGGYPASGPGTPSRVPSPYLPDGLRLDREEGAGEVQTPLLGASADTLKIGDRVWMRHAKAGELCERFNQLHLIDGPAVAATVPTYRGEGQAFL